MALNHSPKIVTDGLVFAYDMANTKKSFKGKPTTNLLYDTTNFSSAANEWNAQENVTVTRGQIAPDGQIQINCVKVKCNSATDSYFGVRSSALTNGNAIHSFSFWAKANKNFTMPIKFGSNQYTATVNLTQNWQYFSVSCPANLGLSVYLHFGGWGSLTDNTLEFYVYQPMYEESSFSTQFVPGGTSRSNTQALVDLTGTNTITASSLTYASDGTFSFNGSSNYCLVANSSSLQVADTFSVSAWIYPTTLSGRYGVFSTRTANAAGSWQLEIGTGNGGTGRVVVTGVGTWIWESASDVLSTNTWYHVCFVKPSNATQGGNMYLNGNLLTPLVTTAYTILNNSVSKSIGAGTNVGQQFPGKINYLQLHNRALSAAEVKQNFNALRGRYGI